MTTARAAGAPVPADGSLVAATGSDPPLLRPSALSREVPAGRRPGWWGMVWFLVTDLATFAALLASYFYLRYVGSESWPPGGIAEPTLRKPLIMTGLLLTSSAPLFFADFGIKKGRRGRLLLGVSLTILLGLGFLSVQYLEYSEKLREFDATTNVYGSLFFAITGFHGLHVVSGLLALTFVLVAAASGRVTRSHHALVRITGLYWHTVGGVWVAILLTVYVSARL